MVKFIHIDNTISIYESDSLRVTETLDKGQFYNLRFAQMRGFYLQPTLPPNVPEKIYGSAEKTADRVLEAYGKSDKNLSVMLVGEKGSGKSMTAALIALKSGLPIVKVDDGFAGSNFTQTLQNLGECVILFDEFEKKFSKDSQEEEENNAQNSLLSLLDGLGAHGKKLFVFTANDEYKIGDYFKNRPSRVRYYLKYKGMESEAITEYCQENLKEFDKYIDKILKWTQVFEDFNFDMLKELVNELNIFGGDFGETIELMNIKPINGAAERQYGYYLEPIKGTWNGVKYIPTNRDSWLSTFDAQDMANESVPVMRAKATCPYNGVWEMGGMMERKKWEMEEGESFINLPLSIEHRDTVLPDGKIVYEYPNKNLRLILTPYQPPKMAGGVSGYVF